MYVKELRDLLESYTKESLEKLIVELYKAVPKKIKEEKAIDDLILNIAEPNYAKSRKSKKDSIDIEQVFSEAEAFIHYANMGYYFKSNRIIAKNQRGKWRSKLKGLIKNLEIIPENDDRYTKATTLLAAIFEILIIGSKQYLFSSFETFKAAGLSPSEFLAKLCKRLFYKGYTEDAIRDAFYLLKQEPSTYEDLYVSSINTFVRMFNTPDSIQLAIDVLKDDTSEVGIHVVSRFYYKLYEPKKALSHMRKNKENFKYLEDYYNNFFAVIAINDDFENWDIEYDKFMKNKKIKIHKIDIEKINDEFKENGEFSYRIYWLI